MPNNNNQISQTNQQQAQQIASQQLVIAGFSATLVDLQTENQALKNENMELKQKADDLQTRLNNEMQISQRKLDQLETGNALLDINVIRLQKENDVLKAENKNLKEQIAELKQKVNQLEYQNRILMEWKNENEYAINLRQTVSEIEDKILDIFGAKKFNSLSRFKENIYSDKSRMNGIAKDLFCKCNINWKNDFDDIVTALQDLKRDGNRKAHPKTFDKNEYIDVINREIDIGEFSDWLNKNFN